MCAAQKTKNKAAQAQESVKEIEVSVEPERNLTKCSIVLPILCNILLIKPMTNSARRTFKSVDTQVDTSAWAGLKFLENIFESCVSRKS